MLIEQARPADFLAIAALDRVAWEGNRHCEFIPDGEHVWRIWCEQALVFVARVDDSIAGAVLAFPCLDRSFCLHKVIVGAAQRGAGVGGALFERLLQEIDRRGIACFLTVDPVNECAIRLYRRWGFDEQTFIAGYYRPNEDRLVLRRSPKLHP